MDKNLFAHIVKRGREEKEEIGFYLIGIRKNNNAYIYDAIEFPYSEKSEVLVASNPHKIGKIFASIPLGLRVIGTLHKHPDSIGSRYSSIDERTFKEWAKSGIYYHVIFSHDGEDVSVYTVIDDKIEKGEFKVKDLTNERLESMTLSIPIEIRIYYHPEETLRDFLNRIERSILIWLAKRFLPLRVTDESLDLKMKEVGIINIHSKSIFYIMTDRHNFFPYEFVYPSNLRFRDIKDEILEILKLDKSTEFFTLDGPIDDNTYISELNGKILYPRKTIHSVIRDIVQEEIKAFLREARREILDLIKKEIEKLIGSNLTCLNGD